MNNNIPLVSVVMPVLNEEEAIGVCIEKIQKVFEANRILGEIVVCDNGSTDRSVMIAQDLGVKVVFQPLPGYGNAYIKGFDSAKGKYLIMAYADDTYDFNEIPNFLNKLINEKYDFVSGSRYLKSPKNRSITWLHRYIGNPFLTWVLNVLFGLNYSDVYSGFRAFSREAYNQIKPVSEGMEFNLELAINARLSGLNVAEIPILLNKRKGKSKLRTFKDGWRSLRMMLLYCPNKVFLFPGGLLFILGILIHLSTLFGWIQYQGRALGSVTAIFATIFSVTGFQIINLGVHLKTYSWSRRFEKQNILLANFYKVFTLERGIMVGLMLLVLGSIIMVRIIFKWLISGLVPIPNPEWVSFAATIIIIGFNVFFSSFFVSAMSIKRNENTN